MNYEAGLLAFVLFYVPIYFIYRNFKQKDAAIEQEYKEKLKKIYNK